ncbi:hypothetical protein ACRHK7_06670 [Weissella tructae]|uniref:hypothetical protein n=1 Tax=Weissella tructae TaxID=887702 RepID=UPI003D8FB7B8
MSKKQMLWIGLAVVAVISLLIGGEIISKQKAEQKQQDNIQTALKLVIDNANDVQNDLNVVEPLLMPRTKENIDAAVFRKKGADSNEYVVKMKRPTESQDNEKDDLGYLKSVDNVKYDYFISYWSVDLSSDEPSISLGGVERSADVDDDDDVKQTAGEKLYEINNYKIDQNPKATVKTISTYKNN